ncbi:hypothetical protein ACLB2K_041180 [Fragaria x ananassa]
MLFMKFPTPGGILTIQGNRAAIEHCHLNAIQQGRGAYEMLPLSTWEPIDDPRDDLEGSGMKRAPRPNPTEVSYPAWVSNVVMVPKPNGKWRKCVDYTNLNKACLMDNFPLPRIDQLVDSTADFKMLSFLDAYSGYNQIKMHPADQAHTTFVTDNGTQ